MDKSPKIYQFSEAAEAERHVLYSRVCKVAGHPSRRGFLGSQNKIKTKSSKFRPQKSNTDSVEVPSAGVRWQESRC
jgi:hypothetical protein